MGNATEEFFDSLVTNAIDFLESSVKEIQSRPKHSVINFFAGLEIFLKARLILEHWSLIIVKPDEAALEQFKNGKFQSVGLDGSIKRLRNIANEIISKEAEQSFNRVREHRNKLVHFFHPAYAKKADETVLQGIVIEQCTAWFYLHNLLSGPWSSHFGKHRAKIEKLDYAMHKLREFLAAKFAAIKPQIDKDISEGVEYIACGSCGFTAARITEEEPPFFEFRCQICGTPNKFLRVPCPKCSSPVVISDMGQGSCDEDGCDGEISLGYLIDQYGPDEDPKEEPEMAYCEFCQHPDESVVPLGDGYLCLWCIDRHSEIEKCEWCGTKIGSFDPDESYLYGCWMCDGGIMKQDSS